MPGGIIRSMPDGSGFVYVGASGPVLRRWDDLSATEVTDAGPVIFDVSPDGREIVFAGADAVLPTAPLGGGPGRRLTDVPAIGPWDWSEDGWVYFTPNPTTPDVGLDLSRVRADGSGEVEAVTTLEEGDLAHVFAQVLPGGRSALFMKSRGSSVADLQIWEVDLETRESWPVTSGVVFQYLPSGHLVYSTAEGELMVAAFDPGSRDLITGVQIPIATGLFLGAQGNFAFTLSPDGTLIFEEALGGGQAGAVEPIWVTREGDIEVIDPAWSFDMGGLGETGQTGWALSPDGTRVAVSVLQAGVGSDIWVKQLPAGPWDRLTQTDYLETSPFWSPDGRYVGFTALGPEDLQTAFWRRRAHGSGEAEPWLSTERFGFGWVQARMSRDGEWFVGRVFVPTGPARDVAAFRADGDRSPIPLIANPEFTEQGADLSPDGTLLAYSSDESGREEVYVRPFPDVDSSREAVSLAGGRNPKWARNGRELFFIDAQHRMNVAEIERTPSPRVIGRGVLFTLQPTWLGGADGLGDGGDDLYDVDVDDQRFLIGRLGGTGAGRVSRFVVVENWLEEVRDQLER